jgi:hypothetical protein
MLLPRNERSPSELMTLKGRDNSNMTTSCETPLRHNMGAVVTLCGVQLISGALQSHIYPFIAACESARDIKALLTLISLAVDGCAKRGGVILRRSGGGLVGNVLVRNSSTRTCWPLRSYINSDADPFSGRPS